MDTVKGYLCETCRLIWVGGFDAHGMGLDSNDASISDSAIASAEYLGMGLTCSDEEDSIYFDCWICDTTGIGGYAFEAEVVA